MKILVIGAGVMSNFLLDSIKEMGHTCIGRVDELCNGEYNSFNDVDKDFDIIIDFSHHSITNKLLDFAIKNNKNVLIATTGHTLEEIDKINKASEKIAIIKATNTSFGVNSLNKIVEYATKILENFDIEIIEAHHNRKIDAPSGTAITLLESIKKARNSDINVVYGRHDEKREENEIGIHSIRAGSIVGEHTVLYSKGDEVIEIKHTALSRKIFSDGAVKAAEKLISKNKGMYKIID